MVDSADPRFDARMDRMEAVIREIQGAQTELRSEQTWLKWMAGIVVTVALAVAGIGLQRSFILTDRLADVRVDTSTIRVIAEKDISAIKADVTAIRAELERVSDAVGAKPTENRAELTAPQGSIQ